ncbi:hypothetical protein DEM27_08180 [Metarhizobium album]|uniref:Uncharacterized protein n=1 Tax=Metarhizobium album TaxID=2182425 RepID=A0A2U2DSU6_9HYPH|nr:hypothetical protein [Rhizobium album]PWE56368.1 hypothetical protein DEM27_08180 [Rhizobium album]
MGALLVPKGTRSTFNSRVSANALVEGRLYFLTDDKRLVVATGANTFVEVQPYDVDTAKLDLAQTFTAAQRAAFATLTDAATVTPNFALANDFLWTIAGTRTLANPTNLVADQKGAIIITTSGANRGITCGSYWKFAGGTAPVLSTASGAVDRLDYHVISSTVIHANHVKDYR